MASLKSGSIPQKGDFSPHLGDMAKNQITSCGSLKDLLSDQKDYLVEEMVKKLRVYSAPGGNVLVDTQEGAYRIKIFIDLTIRALEGKQDLFFLDSELSGYFRSSQYFELSYICQFYATFLTTVNELLRRVPPVEKIKLYEEYLDLAEIIFKGFTILAVCYTETKEEKVMAKIKELQELYEFTHKVLYSYKMEDPLSQREMDVLKGMVEGKSNDLISKTLFISEHTVRSHIKNIYRKLNVSSKGQAVAKAMRLKLFQEL
jgi:DNA-binding CsgD family transcriptional regulator